MGNKQVNITEEMIKSWKAEWGHIYKTEIEGETYIWRKLRRKEHISIMDSSDTEVPFSEKQFSIVKTVVLYPENIDSLLEENFGLVPTLIEQVLTKSGFELDKPTEEL